MPTRWPAVESGIDLLRGQLGLAVLDRPAHDLERLAEAQRRLRRVGPAELAQPQVARHLDHQVVDALDERRVGLEVTGDPQTAQHLLAEPVRGGQRRGVEVGQRGGQPRPPAGDLVVGRVGQQPEQVVVVPGRPGGAGVGEAALGADQPRPDPLAQLLGCHPAERHQHQLVQLGPALGDVAGREGRDRERLAGARAGLEHRGAGRKRAADVEGVAHGESTVSARSSGHHSRHASAPNRCRS